MKKHRFTWIDALILIVVAVSLAGTYFKFFVIENTSVNKEMVEFSYEVRISDIRQCSVDSLQVGDKLYNNDGKGEVGVITDIQVSPAVTNYVNSDNIIKSAKIEDRYNVVLTISAEGSPSSNGYTLGNYNVQVGRHNTYFTKYSIWSATVVAVN